MQLSLPPARPQTPLAAPVGRSCWFQMAAALPVLSDVLPAETKTSLRCPAQPRAAEYALPCQDKARGSFVCGPPAPPVLWRTIIAGQKSASLPGKVPTTTEISAGQKGRLCLYLESSPFSSSTVFFEWQRGRNRVRLTEMSGFSHWSLLSAGGAG